MNKPKVALITGITGQDGAYLAESLLKFHAAKLDGRSVTLWASGTPRRGFALLR